MRVGYSADELRRRFGIGGRSRRSSSSSSNAALDAYKKAAEQAREANEKRYQEGLGIFSNLEKMYQPGGSFGQGALAQYEIGKKQAMAQGMQNLVSSGLANTTTAAGMPLKYEQEVGTPFRLQLEDMRMQNLGNIMQQKAGFIERRNDVAPDPGMFASLVQQGASSPGGGGTTFAGYSPRAAAGLDAFGQPMGKFSSGSIFSSGSRSRGSSRGLSRRSGAPKSSMYIPGKSSWGFTR